ncbi:MAG: efflux RND transporter periplasmic adaptor subunit [Treponema sp.]|nr:efflux RND transporter periplasmic adaptor subunit [Treponema sp.]MCL2272364.1 efflux RND transporter periplasmic adaptor subunit [Treponema sp.]
MKRKILIVIQLTVFLLFACGKNDAGFDEVKNVKAAAAVMREMPDEASGFGSLSFLSKVDIASPQEAVIKKLHFREGDEVRQGDVILLLENPQINLAVERAHNSFSQALAACNLAGSRLLEGVFQSEAQLLALEKAEAELTLSKRRWEEDRRKHQNQETLYEAGGIHTEAILVSRFSLDTEWEQLLLLERELEIRKIGCRDQDLIKAGISVPRDENERRAALVNLMTSSLRAELEAAKAGLEASEKELASANIALGELTIKSPVTAVVGARYLEEGERVRAQDKILSLIDTASLYAIFPVREKDALRIKKGMSASVLVDGTGEKLGGAVDLVYPQADSQSMSFLVRALLDAPSADTNRLKPGMFARVTVKLGSPKRAVFIPENAVFIGVGGSEGSVFVVNGTILSERKLTLGAVNGEEREVTSGLAAGDLVVLRPDSSLREGSNVSLADL